MFSLLLLMLIAVPLFLAVGVGLFAIPRHAYLSNEGRTTYWLFKLHLIEPGVNAIVLTILTLWLTELDSGSDWSLLPAAAAAVLMSVLFAPGLFLRNTSEAQRKVRLRLLWWGAARWCCTVMLLVAPRFESALSTVFPFAVLGGFILLLVDVAWCWRTQRSMATTPASSDVPSYTVLT